MRIAKAPRRSTFNRTAAFGALAFGALGLALSACSTGSNGGNEAAGGNAGDNGAGGDSAGSSGNKAGAAGNSSGGAGGQATGGGGSGGAASTGGVGGQNMGGRAGAAGGGGMAGAGGMAGLGGTAGAGGMAGAGGATPPGTCPALFCDDFEAAATLDAANWSQEMDKGTIDLSSTQTWNTSKRAVHFHINANGGSAFIVHKKVFPALATHLFGRARMYVDPDLNYGHTGIFLGRGSKGNLEVGNYEGGFQLTSPDGLTSGGKIPAKTWACFEWELIESPAKMTVWVDGKANAAFSPATSNLTGGMTSFAFGFNEYHPPAYAVDVYMDDVALGDKRIGCN